GAVVAAVLLVYERVDALQPHVVPGDVAGSVAALGLELPAEARGLIGRIAVMADLMARDAEIALDAGLPKRRHLDLDLVRDPVRARRLSFRPNLVAVLLSRAHVVVRRRRPGRGAARERLPVSLNLIADDRCASGGRAPGELDREPVGGRREPDRRQHALRLGSRLARGAPAAAVAPSERAGSGQDHRAPEPTTENGFEPEHLHPFAASKHGLSTEVSSQGGSGRPILFPALHLAAR